MKSSKIFFYLINSLFFFFNVNNKLIQCLKSHYFLNFSTPLSVNNLLTYKESIIIKAMVINLHEMEMESTLNLCLFPSSSSSIFLISLKNMYVLWVTDMRNDNLIPKHSDDDYVPFFHFSHFYISPHHIGIDSWWCAEKDVWMQIRNNLNDNFLEIMLFTV